MQQNTNSAGSNHSYNICSYRNTIKVGKYDISWSSKQDQNTLIADNVCQLCLKDCTNTDIACYICKLKIHFPCENSSGFYKANNIESGDSSNLKWFCNSCNDISFETAAQLVSSKVLKKAKKDIKNDLEEKMKSEVAIESKQKQNHGTAPHFPNFQK